MGDEAELNLPLSFDGVSYQAADGYVVEFTVKRVPTTAERPHGVSYALVFRPVRGEPYVRFDNAHAADRRWEIRKSFARLRPLAPTRR
jgi:hypothetical protein